jgi:hypothetical protein
VVIQRLSVKTSRDIAGYCRPMPSIFWVNCLNSSRLMMQLVYIQPAVCEANH